MTDQTTRLPESIRRAAVPLKPVAPDYAPLLDWIGHARLVLLGEASHGTHEFYRDRAEITKRLIAEKGFTAVAVEADWPDTYRVNRYVRGESDDGDAEEALRGFKRFPTWMWRNANVLDFVGWLRAYNDTLSAPQTRIGFYGLDLYSLSSSIEAVIRYLDKVDPEAAKRARERYSCFDHFASDTQSYGYAATVGLIEPCETTSSRNWWNCAGVRLSMHGGTATLPKMSSFTRSRTPDWQRTRSSTIARCFADGSHRGICATVTWWKHLVR